MKKYLIAAFTALAIAALVSGCGALPGASRTGSVRTVNIYGTGTVYVVPDIARVNIGVTTQDADAATALSANTQDVNAVRQALVALGVAEEDIQTSDFYIYQQQQYVPVIQEDPELETASEPQTLFVVQNTVLVIVRDLDSLGEVLSKVVDQGANTINSISFELEDTSAAVAEATQKAIDSAASQAQEIADAAGVTLGAINYLSISNGSTSPARSAMMEQAGGDVPISSGTLIIQVTANITYEFN